MLLPVPAVSGLAPARDELPGTTTGGALEVQRSLEDHDRCGLIDDGAPPALTHTTGAELSVRGDGGQPLVDQSDGDRCHA